MLKEQARLFFTALMFLTRIPCPRWIDHKSESLARSVVYFPLVGLLVGVIGALVYALVAQAYAHSVAALFAIAATVIATGAFHEDAFADVCDGFGGWTPQRRLEIMRDSRVGAYGVVGLVLLLGVKGALLGGMSVPQAALALLIGHTVARWSSLILIAQVPYVTDSGSLAKPFAAAVTPFRLTLSTLFVVLVASRSGPVTVATLLLSTLLLCFVAGRFFRRWVGGISGDCLGAVNQLTELVCYMILTKSAILEAVVRRLVHRG